MPRPDLAALGVRYRKTPTMATGRDVYVDTRMIIKRLEELFPPSAEHPALSTKETAGLAGLLNKFSIDVGLFGLAVTMMPSTLPIFKDEKFLKDRTEFSGRPWNAEQAAKNRPQGLVHMRQCFDILEALLDGGKKWVGGTEQVTLADLEGEAKNEAADDITFAYRMAGVWAIDWLISDLQPPSEYFSEAIYPNVYAWRARFKEALAHAKSRAPKPLRLKGEDAVAAVLSSSFSGEALVVNSNDPIGLKAGAAVEVYPTDGGGFQEKDRDRGRLIKLTKDEVAIAVSSPKDGKEVRIHAPRWNFKVREATTARL